MQKRGGSIFIRIGEGMVKMQKNKGIAKDELNEIIDSWQWNKY